MGHTLLQIADGTHSIEISIWSDLISELQENVLYEMTEITVRNYFGQSLATSPGTVARVVADDDNTITINWDTVQAKQASSNTTTICCPEINNVGINIYPICTNEECKKKIKPPPRERVVTCNGRNGCLKEMLLKKCPCGMDVEVQLSKDANITNLTAFPTVLGRYFEEDILLKYKDNKKDLVVKLLELENIDVTYNIHDKIITKITNHEQST